MIPLSFDDGQDGAAFVDLDVDPAAADAADRAHVGHEAHVLAVDEQRPGDQLHGNAPDALEEGVGDQLGAVLVELDDALRYEVDARAGALSGAHQVAVLHRDAAGRGRLPGVVDEGVAAIGVQRRDGSILRLCPAAGDHRTAQDREGHCVMFVDGFHFCLLPPAGRSLAGVSNSSRTAIVSMRAMSPVGIHSTWRVAGSQRVRPRSLRSIRNWFGIVRDGPGALG